MRTPTALILCALLLPTILNAASVNTPQESRTQPVGNIYQDFVSLKIKDVQKLIGRKLTVREKISFLMLKHLAKKKSPAATQGQTALGFGIAAVTMLILGLFIPYMIIGALIAGILAVVLGSVAKKQDPSDKKAYAATLLGWITLGGIALIIILAIAIISAWGWY